MTQPLATLRSTQPSPATMPSVAPGTRAQRRRTFLMCPPEHFTVEYAINPWMDTSMPVDTELALKQWERLRETLVGFGHIVQTLTPEPSLPDMVFAANGAFSVDGVVYGARFRYPQRLAEAGHHRRFYEHGGDWVFVAPRETNEGEGDFAYLPGAMSRPDHPEAGRGLILAGYGYRTEVTAHAEAQELLRRPVISLRLTDPRFYHLDVALATLDDANIAYYPGAFSTSSQKVLAQLFPDAVVADEADALTFGLNLVSDGLNIFLSAEATGLAGTLAAAGYRPVPIELTELKKGGGSVKCCIAELRSARSR